MALQTLNITRFDGAIATLSEKADIQNSAKFIKGMNPFEDPTYITFAKGTTKISSTTVTGLPYWFADGSPWSTNRYSYDSGGKIYAISSADSVSSLRTVSGGAGEGLVVHDNGLYYALGTNIGRYYPLNNSPSFDDALTSWHNATDLQDSGGGTGQTYSTTTGVNEGATHRQTFSVDHDPIVSIVIDVNTVGSGDWTITVHDQNNRSVGSVTVVNGSMGTGDRTFTFSSPLRAEPGESYHFHVTTTVADGVVTSNVASDLEGAEYTVNFGVLIDQDFHMMTRFFGGWAVCNERYIGFFDRLGGTYNPTRIKLDPGFVARTMFVKDEYLIVEAWKGQSFSESEEARRYYWDGIESAYNYAEPLPMGAPNASRSYRNQIVGVYGNRGSIYKGSEENKIIDEVPKLARGKIIEVYPGAIDEYEERLVIGYAGSTNDSSGVEQGVYEYGNQSGALVDTLNYPYIISTSATQSTSMKIGALGVFGTDLYIGWLSSDGTTYGIDKVENDDNATTETVSWESRVFDAGDPNKTDQAIKIRITFEALTTGQTITPKYQINRSGSFTTGTAATSGSTEAELFINSNFREIEFGFNGTSSSGTFPVITGILFIYEDELEGEDS